MINFQFIKLIENSLEIGNWKLDIIVWLNLWPKKLALSSKILNC